MVWHAPKMCRMTMSRRVPKEILEEILNYVDPFDLVRLFKVVDRTWDEVITKILISRSFCERCLELYRPNPFMKDQNVMLFDYGKFQDIWCLFSHDHTKRELWMLDEKTVYGIYPTSYA